MFWKRIYKSKHTGAEIDAAVDKALPFKATFTIAPAVNTWDATCDKTYEEIKAAADAGKALQFVLSIPSASIETVTDTYTVTSAGYVASTMGVISNDVVFVSVLITSEAIDANVTPLAVKS